jgi:hypothetical protein
VDGADAGRGRTGRRGLGDRLYNYIVQHNPTPPGFETGAGNAYETDLRDKTRGRIYRIVPTGHPARIQVQDLSRATPARLVEALGDDNLLWRQHAQRLLVERGELDVVPALVELLAGPHVDLIGNDPTTLHALWTLHGLDVVGRDMDAARKEAVTEALGEELTIAVEDAVVRAIRSPAWGVRRAALQLLPRADWARDLVLSSGVLGDTPAKVRLAALTTLAEMPPSDDAGAAAFAALVAADEAGDRWLVDAATIAAAAHDAGFLKALLASRLAADARSESGAPPRNLVTNGSFEEGPDGPRTRLAGAHVRRRGAARGRARCRAHGRALAAHLLRTGQ